MKQEWSSKWSASRQARKQRKYRHKAPLHIRHKFMSVHLSPGLRRQHSKRSVPVRKGDEVELMCGEMKKRKGTVERVNMSTCKVYIEGLNVKKSDGSEVLKPFEPSNLMITKLKLDDKMRQRVFKRAEEAKKTALSRLPPSPKERLSRKPEQKEKEPVEKKEPAKKTAPKPKPKEKPKKKGDKKAKRIKRREKRKQRR